MKKKYAKPYLAVESFQLVAALAGSCAEENRQFVLNYGLDNCGPVNGFFSDHCVLNEGGKYEPYQGDLTQVALSS